MYNFSAPMPYTIDGINKLLDINNLVQKSAVTSLYACVPRGSEVFTGFEQSRNFLYNNISWDYWKGLIERTLEKGCDFIYLLNSPRPLDIDNPNFPKSLEKLELLLSELKKLGVNKLRIASGQLMSYIGRHYPGFKVLASTSLEYKTIWEYQNFFFAHPEVRQAVPSHDVNKNFKLLSALKKCCPDKEIELMVNEGCLQGCPNRMFHEMVSIDKHTIINNDVCLSLSFATNFCRYILKRYPVPSLAIGSLIFPWDIEEYSKIGINNFKFAGRDGYLDDFEGYLEGFSIYLKGIDDIKSIENHSLVCFVHHLKNNSILSSLSIKKYKKYLPDIKYFVKYGHLCASRCSVDCRYCYKCADKIEKAFAKEMKRREEKIPQYVPACTCIQI